MKKDTSTKNTEDGNKRSETVLVKETVANEVPTSQQKNPVTEMETNEPEPNVELASKTRFPPEARPKDDEESDLDEDFPMIVDAAPDEDDVDEDDE